MFMQDTLNDLSLMEKKRGLVRNRMLKSLTKTILNLENAKIETLLF
jgi:hypothetical protein